MNFESIAVLQCTSRVLAQGPGQGREHAVTPGKRNVDILTDRSPNEDPWIGMLNVNRIANIMIYPISRHGSINDTYYR